ncbi:MAG: putative protein phosphatase 2C-type [Chlamydiae bacterium]|nr:putative protein phosphatase 2C-type [Chlamydiota bacterium]
MSIRVESWGLTDIGLVRTNNEDVWSQLKDDQFFIIADGMGGHRAGEVAAKEAVEALSRIVSQGFREKPSKDFSLNELKEFLYSGIIDVNSVVYSIGSSDDSLRGMGTTLCCLCVVQEGVVYAHVGDSRIYRLRDGQLSQLTTDHTLVAPYVDTSNDEPQNKDNISYKNFLTRTIGNDPLTIPDVEIATIQNGDIYMLCSDGLTDMVPPEEIERVMLSSPTVQDCAQDLVTIAKVNGGIDNVTVVVLKLIKDA